MAKLRSVVTMIPGAGLGRKVPSKPSKGRNIRGMFSCTIAANTSMLLGVASI
jgi:hypothetical protein